jgi:hypothetical protein
MIYVHQHWVAFWNGEASDMQGVRHYSSQRPSPARGSDTILNVITRPVHSLLLKVSVWTVFKTFGAFPNFLLLPPQLCSLYYSLKTHPDIIVDSEEGSISPPLLF